MKNILVKCENCGCEYQVNDMYKFADDEYYCFDCVSVCEECGCMDLIDDMIIANPGTQRESYICSDCAENSSRFFRCRDCEEYFSFDFHWNTYQGEHICQNCSSAYFVCQECEGVFPESEIEYDERSDTYLCPSCYEERTTDIDSLIEDYYYKPEPEFFGGNTENCFMGVELEVDNTSGAYDAKAVYNAAETIIDEFGDRLYLKHDGSLSCGFEIVSHPCSLEYHSKEFNWQEIMRICREGTLYSHDTSTCGLHIHLSRLFFGDTQEIQDLHISKLLILISKFYYSHILKFSRRKQSELHWCENPSMEYDDTDNEITIVDKMKQCKSKGRYLAVNLQNQNTVEFRLFKGTLKFNTLIASLQFVVEISRYAKRTKLKQILTASWSDIFMSTEFDELKNYLIEKELI